MEPKADATPLDESPRSAPSTPPGRSVSVPVALLQAMRPKQWTKNLFVGAPVLFGKSLGDTERLERAAAAVAIFCVISSAVYLWNDLLDVDKDRAHPRKRFRPIAAGTLPMGVARAASGVLAVLGLGLAVALSPAFGGTVALYLLLNAAYTLRLKHVPYLDVLIIASGFLLRVIGGGAATGVHLSRWLLLCTGLLASFNGFGKRAHELATSGSGTRKALAGYHPERLRWLLYATGAATVFAYLLYTLSPHTREYFHTDNMVWTVPSVAIGVGRFLQLVSGRPTAESPTQEMLRDALFVGNVVVWVGAVVAIIYTAL